MRKIGYLAVAVILISCAGNKSAESKKDLQSLAEQYVRLGLAIGQYDADFVDAYYGPDSLRPTGNAGTVFPKDSFLAAISDLSVQLKEIGEQAPDSTKHRAEWIRQQLTAFDKRVHLFGGDSATFDEESLALYGVKAPSYTEQHFQALVAALDSTLSGKGNIPARFQQLANRFVIPKDKLDTVFKTAIAECRKRTKEHYKLPETESFTLEYVTDKPWSGYNWYKGNYRSVIQINTDLDILIDRAIDVGSHESYPGHHVYNMLLEKNLYRDKGWLEISLYPLFSPQSLISEGSANYGIALAFPGDEKIRFAKEVLLPLAGLDTTGITAYFHALEIKDELNYARNEIGRGLLNGTMTEKEAMRWLQEYGLMNEKSAAKSISFIRRNRSYVINYNYGKDLVKAYIEGKGGVPDDATRWNKFSQLLSNEVRTSDLLQ